MNGDVRFTTRLRLEPIGLSHIADLVLLHGDPNVAKWYAGTWTTATANKFARTAEREWHTNSVFKWMAYDRTTGALVGRGGLSRLESGRTADQINARYSAWGCTAERLEVGWAIRDRFLRKGFATEIGREALSLAFGELGATCVAAFTEVHNRASRAVMERLEMEHIGEIVAGGLLEGREGVHEAAPFALYMARRRMQVGGD